MRRIATTSLAIVLTLGGATAVLAQPGGPELPTQVADVLGIQNGDEELDLEVEEEDEPSSTALDNREGRGDGDGEGEAGGEKNADFVAFVKTLMDNEELSGCERGAMISAVASSGPAGERNFDAADNADTSHCDRGEVSGGSEDEPGARGRDRAEQAKANAGGADVETDDEERGGPPEGKGKPDTDSAERGGPPEGKGKPAHAGEGDDDQEGLEVEEEELEEEEVEVEEDEDEELEGAGGPPEGKGKPAGVGGSE